MAKQLRLLNAYASVAQQDNLPALVAVDVGDTEATPQLALDLLGRVGALDYPVALDPSGAVADAYGAQDLHWLAMTDLHGRVRWSHDGWLSVSNLEAGEGAAMRATPTPAA